MIWVIYENKNLNFFKTLSKKNEKADLKVYRLFYAALSILSIV